MHHQYNSFKEDLRQAFRWHRSALHEIHHAIGRARRIPRTRIRIVPTGPERITWYECPRCGTPVSLDSRDKRCTVCRVAAVPRAWVRPDVARADERARRRRARFTWVGTGPADRQVCATEIADADPWTPLPDGNYRIIRKSRGPG
jgi:hypothetical protein